MTCQNLVMQQESLEVLKANVKQILLEETAYSEADLERRLIVQNQCVLWIGTKNNKGYGKAWHPKTKKLILLHRLVWTHATKQKLIPYLVILHSCDTPNCIGYHHLSQGSKSENTRQAVSKGRMNFTGELNNRTKLTENDVREIRHLFKSGVMQKDIAVQYKLKPNSVSYIISRKNWKNVQ